MTFSIAEGRRSLLLRLSVIVVSRSEIDRYGFFEADIDISAIHGPITDISKIFKSCFLLLINYHKYSRMYYMPYFFSKTSKIRIYELKFFKLQPFQYFAMIFN